jgi:hypothetical protein
MNALQIATGSVITFLFGYLFSVNADLSWIILGIIALIFLPLGVSVMKQRS